MILNSDDARLKFDGIGTDNATSEDTTNKLGTNKAELIQLTNGSSNIFAAVAKNGQSILVQEDDYQTPTAFFGNRSGLNFSEYDRDVSVNLAEGTGKLNNLNATFHGINKLQAGDGMSTLIGDSNRNTLIAGNGYTSLRGGAGNDTLVGKGNSDDKEGWTNFFFMAGDERDVIKDFGFITPDNRDSGTEDKINVEYTDVSNVYVFNDEVIIEFDRDNQLILEDARGKHFYINNLIAKADKNIAYDGITDRYVAGGGSNLTVDPTVDSAEIWLDNSHDTMFLGTPIRTLDASNVKGNTSLVGNEFNNTILAGQGDSKLWGGHSTSNDLLIGGNSRNTFFYCNGNGRDTIAGAHDGDAVILSDVTLDQISETSITKDAVAINFKDGGSLQINSRADVTYQLADGSKYFANHEQATWIAKSTTT